MDTTTSRVIDLAKLTSRELEVLDLICEGLGNQEIADRLHISRGTINSYVGSILRKLGVKSRTAAMSMYLRANHEPREEIAAPPAHGNHRFNSLATRMAALILVAVFSSGAAAAFVVVQEGRAALQDQMFRDQEASAAIAAQLTTRYVESAEIAMEEMASRAGLVNEIVSGDGSGDEMHRRFAVFLSQNPRFQSLRLFDLSGKVLAKGLPLPSPPANDEDWFEATVTTRKPYFSTLRKSHNDGQPVLISPSRSAMLMPGWLQCWQGVSTYRGSQRLS